METNNNPNDTFMISFSDLMMVCRRAKRKILAGVVIGAFLAAFFTLSKPVEYRVEATFKEQGEGHGGLNSPLASLAATYFSGSLDMSSNKSQAQSIMKSRKAMEPVIREFGLQASFSGSAPGILSKIFSNLRTSYAHFMNKRQPIFSRSQPDLTFSDVEYSREVPEEIRLIFTDENTFKVLGPSKVDWGSGKIGEPFKYDDIRFIVNKNVEKKYKDRKYYINFEPMSDVAKNLLRPLKFEVNKKDSSLLLLTYSYNDRILSSKILNSLMAQYQSHLRDLHDKQLQVQLGYLNKRQKETKEHLEGLMMAHADSISDDVSNMGLLDPQKELEYLSQSQHAFKKKNMEINLEVKRLETLQREGLFDVLGDTTTQSIVNNMCNLRQQRDSLKLAIQKFSDSNREKLVEKETFKQEFQGIDLPTSRELYVNYIRQLNETQAEIMQYEFLGKQLEHPDFEVSALSLSLKDPISQSMVAKTSELALRLRDQSNRSDREQDRVKEELLRQRAFVGSHLLQSSHLLQLREKLLEDKIHDLQKTTLELVNQQISILEKQISDYLTTRINFLEQEHLLIDKQLNDIHNSMAALPKKWMSEQLITHHLKQNVGIVEEIAKLVEAKNISHNLNVVQSYPLDAALPPILPKSPHLLVYLFLGGTLGAFMAGGIAITQAFIAGFPATQHNLKLAKQCVAGYLSKNSHASDEAILLDQDLETLRRLFRFAFEAYPQARGTLLCIINKGPDYSQHLCGLIAAKGFKVLRLELSAGLSISQNKHSQPAGLFDYLDGKTKVIPIVPGADYDTLSFGEISRFSNERISSPSFRDLLRKLESQYEWVIAVSSSSPCTAEGENLLRLFPCVSVSVINEKLQDLTPYLSYNQKSDNSHKIAFVVTEVLFHEHV